MLTILSMIVGFVSSLAPDLLKLFQDGKDKKHELDLLKFQSQMADASHLARMDEIGIDAYSKIVTSAHRSQDNMLKNSSKWVVDFSASVRPVVTYLFIIAFIGFKAAAFCAAINPSLPWQEPMDYLQAMMFVWGEEETAIFAGIIAYWFGDRSLTKRRA
jgi:hypothetical protein